MGLSKLRKRIAMWRSRRSIKVRYITNVGNGSDKNWLYDYDPPAYLRRDTCKSDTQ